MESDKTLYGGYWNGEFAQFRVINLLVSDQTQESIDHFKKFHPNGKQYLWYKPYVGKVMEAVEVHQGDSEPFHLSNIDGTGLYKVIDGMGSPQCGHKSIYGEVIEEIDEKNWTHYDKELVDKINKEVDDWWMDKAGDEYVEHKKRMEKLKVLIRGGSKVTNPPKKNG